jgi:hypothetical protein
VNSYDKDGNLLVELGEVRIARYEYNGMNRMVYSEVRDLVKETDREGMRTRYFPGAAVCGRFGAA